ncbi:HD domain-containing phosphohydrolase [Thalassotalea piscium]
MSMFVFKEEDAPETAKPINTHKKVWRILVVDDDESVHQITKLVLSDTIIENRALEIISVFSSKEAKVILKNDDTFCMAFIDVVMETEHAGLELVDWIRNDLKNQSIRLILRTGQAGNAPEAKVIKDFDINDYKEKTDFTSSKMITTVYAAIRAYRDIMTIQRSLDAFKQLIKSTQDLLKMDQFKSFGSAALNNLLTLMDLDSSALYIARNQTDYDQQQTHFILACTGKYVSESDDLCTSKIDDSIKQLIKETFENKTHFRDEKCFIGYYETANNVASVLYIEFEDDNEHFRSHLAELFATNVVLILEGLTKQHEIDRTQKELIYIVGDAIEARNNESGKHVHRVSLVCEVLAEKIGLTSEHVRDIRLAAPLHDIGKIIIPESIIHKQGQLDEAEWLLMKQHTEIGSELLSKSKANISKLGAKMAHSHHENWDGTGYPEGLVGENIPLEARIMAIADVYDSLRSTRAYKAAWNDEQIKTFFIEQKGKKFEPYLVDVFLDNYAELNKIESDWS